MLRDKNRLVILYLVILEILALVMFLSGFFPDKSNFTGTSRNDFPTSVDGVSESLIYYSSKCAYSTISRLDEKVLYKKHKTSVVLMVIDALRFDFVYGENSKEYMPYLSSQLNNNCLVKAKVEPPTVTMPRIKSMVTGSIPSFYDAAKNFGIKKLTDDNILAQAANHNMNLIFYGDDTWMHLFPDTFFRSEGTTSFFVSDFVEVDKNVTRNLDRELKNTDWDIMILHYLGLDHIGHIQGPFGTNIKYKLLEMDEIAEKIHHFLNEKKGKSSSMLIICGDHGMKDSGGHGGTSPNEVYVPFIILNYECDFSLRYDQINQVDFTSLFSVLMGLPIPGGSVGALNLKLLSGLDLKSALYSMYYNSQRMIQLFKLTDSSEILSIEKFINDGAESYKYWILSNYSNDGHIYAAGNFSIAQNKMSSIIIKNSVHFDMYLMVIAMVILTQIIILLSNATWDSYNIKWDAAIGICFALILIIHYYSCFFFEMESKLCEVTEANIFFIGLLFGIILTNLSLLKSFFIQLPNTGEVSIILIGGIILHLLSLSSTSFIEEEHEFWYFWITSLLIYIAPLNWQYCGLLLGVQTFLRKINQTGDKWAHLPDLEEWLNLEGNKNILSVFYVLGLVSVYFCLTHRNNSVYKTLDSVFYNVLIVSQLMLIYLTRVAVGTCVLGGFASYLSFRGVFETRLFWAIFILKNILRIGSTNKMSFGGTTTTKIFRILLDDYTMVLALLVRPHNIILVPSMYLFSFVFGKTFPSNVYWLSLTHLWLGWTFYFYQGNSNSFANIDVAIGFIGLTDYHKFISGCYIFLHIFMGPITLFLLLMNIVAKNNLLRSMAELNVSCSILLVNSVTHTFLYDNDYCSKKSSIHLVSFCSQVNVSCSVLWTYFCLCWFSQFDWSIRSHKLKGPM